MATNPDRGLLVSWACSHYVLGKHDGVRIRIVVVSARLMPLKVFAYRMLPKSPQTGAKEGYFSHVCSPPDIADYPEDGPVPPNRPEWFRLDYVDIMVRSMTEAEDFLEVVESDLRRLKRTYDTMDVLVPGGAIAIGNPPVTSSSSLSSLSSESAGG
jgi:hypothetical protein